MINYYRYLDKMLNLCRYCTYCSDDHNFFIFNFYWLYTQYIGQGRQGNVAPVIPVYGIYISEGFQFFGLGNLIASTASPKRGIRIFGECEEFRQIIYNTYLPNLNFQKFVSSVRNFELIKYIFNSNLCCISNVLWLHVVRNVHNLHIVIIERCSKFNG